MEHQKEPLAPVAVEEDADRRLSRLVDAIPATGAFAGWGPRMTGSVRDVLRGLN